MCIGLAAYAAGLVEGLEKDPPSSKKEQVGRTGPAKTLTMQEQLIQL